VAVLIPITDTGMYELAVDPFPSSPSPLTPQHWTAPLASNAQVVASLEATAVALLIPLTVTGVLELVVVPSPSSP
jgi:hypothetical protein